MYRKNTMVHDMICPHCGYFIGVKDPFAYFASLSQKCGKCGKDIPVGDAGLDTQIALHLKRDGRTIYAEMLYSDARQKTAEESAQYVSTIAAKNGIILKKKK